MSRRLLLALMIAAVPLAAIAAQLAFDEPWWTRDQQGMRRFRGEAYAEAAARFADPRWRALSLYRAGRFEEAANAFSGLPGPEAAYNRGNALVFLGKYEEAVESYGRALELRPDWSEAEENRRVAELRIRTETAAGDATEIGADDITFDQNESKGGDPVEVTAGEEMSDEALRALWLRNVQTRPADFLRSKFAYQRSREESQ